MALQPSNQLDCFLTRHIEPPQQPTSFHPTTHKTGYTPASLSQEHPVQPLEKCHQILLLVFGEAKADVEHSQGNDAEHAGDDDIPGDLRLLLKGVRVFDGMAGEGVGKPNPRLHCRVGLPCRVSGISAKRESEASLLARLSRAFEGVGGSPTFLRATVSVALDIYKIVVPLPLTWLPQAPLLAASPTRFFSY